MSESRDLPGSEAVRSGSMDDFDSWLAGREKGDVPSGGRNVLKPGQRIGAYRIIRLLGAGGMGAVYEVEHVELGTHYALKAFSYDVKDEYAGILLNKFREEARMLARINHPCVSRAFDLTYDVGHGVIYYVMNLVLYKDGESYSLDEVDRESLDEDLVYGWFCDACEALDHIHSLGIVHRDVKLANFLVNSDKHVVLADFGISRIFGAEMKKEVAPYKTMRIKRNGQTEKTILGSDHYIAPEVKAGQEAKPAADAYSLGIMIFKLFTDKWADNMSITQVDACLHGYKYRWYKVVPRLLEFDPTKRPTRLADLIPLLDRKAASTPNLEQKLLEKKAKAGPDWIRLAVKVFFVGALCVGGCLFYRGWRQHETDERVMAERLAEMQRQSAGQPEAEKVKVITNVVERVVERTVVQIVETNVVDRVSAEAPSEEEPAPYVLGEGCSIETAEYGLCEDGNPVPGWCVDIKAQLGERIRKGEYEIRVDNRLAGCDPAGGRHKQARIRYVWNGETKTALLREGEKFMLPRDDVRRMFPKEEFVVVKGDDEDEDAKDYGPIPDKKYVWFKGGSTNFPQEVKFQLANGAMVDLVPMKAMTFFMSNDRRAGRTHHKVTITRPFWMSKYIITAAQCRDFAPEDFDDCRDIEKALEGTVFTVSKVMDRRQIDAFCKYLSRRYAKQLPDGYVFRLPTEAEWECALDMEASFRKYEDIIGGWYENCVACSGTGRRSMKDLRRDKNLDSVCEWDEYDGWGCEGGLTRNRQIFVGGRMKPQASGVCDLYCEGGGIWNLCLDVIDGSRRFGGSFWIPSDELLCYTDEEMDPLNWLPAGTDIYETAVQICREGSDRRYAAGMNCRFMAHVVLGPDLVVEQASRQKPVQRERPLRKRPLTMLPERWKPTSAPRKLSHEKRYSFKLDNGACMEFCLCPAGTFSMSNVPGQTKQFHGVQLTRPFLISKFNVTANQWRDYGRHDCEGTVREMEKLFAKEKFPICIKRNYLQWCRFCDHLTERYRAILPEGYVFRLPTEAEMEWAMTAGEKMATFDRSRFDDCSSGHRDDLKRSLEKKRFGDIKHFDTCGWYRSCYVGGRTPANSWGVCDIRHDKVCLDFVMADARTKPELLDSNVDWGSGVPVRDLVYAERTEIDPVRWDGLCGDRYVVRHFNMRRSLSPLEVARPAHIVIGPDVLTENKKAENEPHPMEAFGGRFVGDRAKVSGMSSAGAEWANTPERQKLLLSRENTIVKERVQNEDWRCCLSAWEDDSPWIQIELDKPMILAGIEVDAYRDNQGTRHLRIWASDGGKEMWPIAKEDRQLSRYRFDLQGKNIKAKYIRVGREPGFMNDRAFGLNKILIYCKER